MIRVLVLVLTLGAPAGAFARDAVVVYHRADLRGPHLTIARDWPGGGPFAGRIRSIHVPPGASITLYSEPRYRGASAKAAGDWSIGPTGWWARRVRSIRITPAPRPSADAR